MILERPGHHGTHKAFTLIELLVSVAIVSILAGIALPALMGAREAGRRVECQSHLHQLGLGMLQYFDDWNGQFFLHHPFEADVLSQVRAADSFAEIYWEDKLMPYVNASVADEALARAGIFVSDSRLYRCPSDVSRVEPFLTTVGTPDGVANRTSYLMNSLLSHRTRRYGRWVLPRIQCEIGTSNFLAFNERDAAGLLASPASGEPRQDDYDIWLGTDVLDTWIPWSRHGAANGLFADGHARPLPRGNGYRAMYPGGQSFPAPQFYDR